MYEVFNYVSPSGKDFVNNFISSLSSKAAKGRIDARIDYLKEFGPMAKFPYVEHLGNKIYYIRLSVGKLEIRIFYFFDKKNIILTHGFLKKTSKLPTSEITHAKVIYREHFK